MEFIMFMMRREANRSLECYTLKALIPLGLVRIPGADGMRGRSHGHMDCETLRKGCSCSRDLVRAGYHMSWWYVPHAHYAPSTPGASELLFACSLRRPGFLRRSRPQRCMLLCSVLLRGLRHSDAAFGIGAVATSNKRSPNWTWLSLTIVFSSLPSSSAAPSKHAAQAQWLFHVVCQFPVVLLCPCLQ